MNETSPREILALAIKITESIESSQASPVEKAAALRVAATAQEQAALAQQMAQGLAAAFRNLGKGSA